jgi:hypothetical protein
LEYNILEDVACCLYCYLFKPNTEHQAGGNSFVTEGFKNWKKKKKKKLHNHVGAHNIALAIFFLIILIKFLLTIVFFFHLSKKKKKNLAPQTKILAPPLVLTINKP